MNLITKLVVLLIFSNSLIWSKQIGKIEPDAKDAEICRYGNSLIYSWNYYNGGTKKIFEIWINFFEPLENISFIHAAENIHAHGEWHCRYYIYHDEFNKYVIALAEELRRLSYSYCINEVSLALSFVQGLPYQRMKNYQKRPSETLVHGAGVCSDAAVLFASILYSLNYSVVLEYSDHLAVAVYGDNSLSGTYVQYRAKKYYFCENTGVGWDMG